MLGCCAVLNGNMTLSLDAMLQTVRLLCVHRFLYTNLHVRAKKVFHNRNDRPHDPFVLSQSMLELVVVVLEAILLRGWDWGRGRDRKSVV